jgi:hypothetical protein
MKRTTLITLATWMIAVFPLSSASDARADVIPLPPAWSGGYHVPNGGTSPIDGPGTYAASAEGSSIRVSGDPFSGVLSAYANGQNTGDPYR